MFKALILGIISGDFGGGGNPPLFLHGQAPVAVTAPPMPFERKYAHKALDAYLDKLPHPAPQIPADEPNYLAGAEIYKQNCAVCHGLPGGERQPSQRECFRSRRNLAWRRSDRR